MKRQTIFGKLSRSGRTASSDCLSRFEPGDRPALPRPTKHENFVPFSCARLELGSALAVELPDDHLDRRLEAQVPWSLGTRSSSPGLGQAILKGGAEGRSNLPPDRAPPDVPLTL